MPRSWFQFLPLLFTPETDPSAGGGGGGGAPAGGDAGGGTEDQAAEPTLKDILTQLQLSQKGFDQYRHATNKELEKLRRTRGEAPEPRKDGEGKVETQPEHVTRDELRAEREYSRGLGKLEALGLDADALDEIEDHCEDLSPTERARYVAAFAQGLARAGKKEDTTTQVRDRDDRRRRTQTGKGGETPPAPRGSDVPRTIAEYKALKKKDPVRARELLTSGEVDLVSLRQVS